jgi:hypothetical protein
MWRENYDRKRKLCEYTESMKLAFKNSWNHFGWTYFRRVLAIRNRYARPQKWVSWDAAIRNGRRPLQEAEKLLSALCSPASGLISGVISYHIVVAVGRAITTLANMNWKRINLLMYYILFHKTKQIFVTVTKIRKNPNYCEGNPFHHGVVGHSRSLRLNHLRSIGEIK